jgi:NAD(P)-dependent dehydrogenase (short-subunit alcohol dehydrogenase family)
MTTTFEMTGRVGIVTGGTGGMGRAITVALARSGATVVACDRAGDDGAALVDECASLPGSARFSTTDVTSSDEVRQLVEHTMTQFGRLDFAVNAAAIEFETVGLADCEDDDFDRMMAVNLRGIFLCMKYQLRAMLTAGNGGSIVNIASTNSFRPQPHQPVYTAGKHAVIGLTKSAAMDYARNGIRVNAICPGPIDTPMLQGAIARRGRDVNEVANRLTSMGRLGTADEIAQAALWLCSDASSFTNGHALAVDGGMLAS